MILTCLMKSFDVSRHMPSIITWITQCCRYCQESNLYSCSQNTINWIFSSQHYIQCPLQMDLLLLFLYFMSKPFWLHFLMIFWECARRTLHPIMISLHQLLMKYILDHFVSRLDKNTVVMIQMLSPSTGLLLWQNKYWCIWFTFMCTIHLYTIILEQRLLQWWLKLHG